MEESGGDIQEGRDEISLLAEELVLLSVKGSIVVPSSKPTLYVQSGQKNYTTQKVLGHILKAYGRQGKSLRFRWWDKTYF